jgi:hypothetical protein
MRLKGAKLVWQVIFGIAMLILVNSARAESSAGPDELGVYGPKAGYYTVRAIWGKSTYEIQVKGELTDTENERILKEWISRIAKEQSEK